MELTWEEEQAQKNLDYMEAFIHKNRNSKSRLPDGEWVDVIQDLSAIVEGFELSKTTLARWEQVRAFFSGLSKPKLMADEIQEAESNSNLLGAVGGLKGDDLENYIQEMSDAMEEDTELDDWN